MTQETDHQEERWLSAKLRNFYPRPNPETVRALTLAVHEEHGPAREPLFENPFQIEDLLVFDDETLSDLLAHELASLLAADLACSLHGASARLVEHISHALPHQERGCFRAALCRNVTPAETEAARWRLLDALFWELTYWKTPDLYEELTSGERIHPGIFRRLAPDLRGKRILDAGAGSGRATFECLRRGAQHLYAVEPSPGLLRLLEEKLAYHPARQRITPIQGRFDALPLADQSVDLSLACSAFTVEQGGEPGLAELKRVTRPGGKIVFIWPRPEEYHWLAARSFHYEALPMPEEPRVRFQSLSSALRAARRFYARQPAVQHYLSRSRRPDVPFSILTPNPPHDYCWLRVDDQG